MFGPCKCCLEKASRISDLQQEVSFLRKLVRPEPVSNSTLSLIQLEQDAILSGTGDLIQISPEDLDTADAILREQDALLTANY